MSVIFLTLATALMGQAATVSRPCSAFSSTPRGPRRPQARTHLPGHRPLARRLRHRRSLPETVALVWTARLERLRLFRPGIARAGAKTRILPKALPCANRPNVEPSPATATTRPQTCLNQAS